MRFTSSFRANSSMPKIEDLIIYESAGIVAIQKPSGTISTGDSFNSISLLIRDLQVSSTFVPQVAHRLDVNTTGIILAAWDEDALIGLQDQFANRTIKKEYWALLDGKTDEESGIIDSPIFYDVKYERRVAEYKNAITEYHTMQTNDMGMSFMRFQPRTGRTHQLRIHSAEYLGTPIMGDRNYHENFKYGRPRGERGWLSSHYTKAAIPMDLVWQMDGQMLHARSIRFKHPITNEQVFIESPLPENRENIWRGLGFDPDAVKSIANDPDLRNNVKTINGGENVRKWKNTVTTALQYDNQGIHESARMIAKSIVAEFSNARRLKMKDLEEAVARRNPGEGEREKVLEYLAAGF